MSITKSENKIETAAEIYEVQPNYQRFDQKNNLTRQSFWNPAVMETQKKLHNNLERKIRNNLPGYGLLDWAFYKGAIANMTNNGFSINWANRRGNSWQPLARLTQAHSMVPSVDYGKMEANTSIATRAVKRIARQFGADEVGVCLVDRKWVYSYWYDEETREHYPIRFSDEPGYEVYQEPVQLEDRTQVIPANMKFAVVLVHEMDERGMATAPTLTQMATTFTTYSKISFTTVMLAEFIRGLGYNAIPSANDTALNIPLAIDAGLGELGRNAKLITPRYGPRCRISKVITDLPLIPDEVRLWGVTEFCNICRKCVTNCPVNAIPEGERSFEPLGIYNHRGVLLWQLDHMKCYQYWAEAGTNCGICIRVCPFNKSQNWIHNLVRQVIKMKNRNLDFFINQMDDLFGYGKFKEPSFFWLTDL